MTYGARIFILLITAAVVVTTSGCASHPLDLSCEVAVPSKFTKDPPEWVSPTGEPESLRYTKSYEAFWWNCVMVKAVDYNDTCPFSCSGTPAATYGCAEGAADAKKQIRHLLRTNTPLKVTNHLESIASSPEGKSKISAYFPNGPSTGGGVQ